MADFRVSKLALTKLPRDRELILELEPTEDIVRSVVNHRRAGTLVIAFAAEMGLDIKRAREKLHRKGADAIVLNDIARTDIGFDSTRNAAIFITREAEVSLSESSKGQIAALIIDEVVKLRSHRHATTQLS